MLLVCTNCRREWNVGSLKAGVKVQCPSDGGPMVPAASQGTPYLLVHGGPADGQRFELEGVASIGSAASCTFVLADASVAGFHARVVPEGSGWALESLAAGGGLKVNSLAARRRTLADGDWIELGDVSLTYVAGSRRQVSLSVLEPGPEEPVARVASAVTRADAAVQQLLARFARVEAEAAALEKLQGEQPLAERLVEAVREMFQPARAAVLLFEGRAAASGSPAMRLGASWTREGQTIEVSSTVCRRVLKTGAPLVVGDVLSDPGIQPTQSILGARTRSVIAAPLNYQGEPFGLLYADTTDLPDAFGSEDLPVFGALAGIGAMALSADRLAQRLEQESVVRAHLARYLAPELVEEVASGRISWKPGGELKEVTVLFSDMRGFTSASEHMAPADVVAMLNDYFSLMVDEIYKEGGTLDKFVGDAIMAVWGSPVTRELDSLAAVRAAMGMQRALAVFNEHQVARGRSTVAMGVGVNTGQAIAGNIGAPSRMDFTVIGDVVNLASRIESQTGPGQIFIGKATFDRVQGQVPIRPIGAVAVKGRKEPAFLYEVLWATQERERPTLELPRRVHCHGGDRRQAWPALLMECDAGRLVVAARPEDPVGDVLHVGPVDAEAALECRVIEKSSGTDRKGRNMQLLKLEVAPADRARIEQLLSGR
ncbi:MAG: GAF domain-containing protein [Candidatus Wallbacteria bacterium]|nr:GAF domain-containing protein [Candidatus Wallbacteria bacterium]